MPGPYCPDCQIRDGIDVKLFAYVPEVAMWRCPQCMAETDHPEWASLALKRMRAEREAREREERQATVYFFGAAPGTSPGEGLEIQRERRRR